jgi:hypothetical protein
VCGKNSREVREKGHYEVVGNKVAEVWEEGLQAVGAKRGGEVREEGLHGVWGHDLHGVVERKIRAVGKKSPEGAVDNGVGTDDYLAGL